MNPTRPLRDDVTDLNSCVRTLEFRITILVRMLLTGSTRAYDAMMTAQASKVSLSAVNTVHSVMFESSKKIAAVESALEKSKKELEKTKKEVEHTKNELTEEVKKRKALEMKVDMMFQWFKAQEK
jgi:septal ring factor EnvC (AmiA/AmiB activator)